MKMCTLRDCKEFMVYICDLFIVRFLRSKKMKTEGKRLLIVRLDAIGDYVLFRNFLKYLKESKDFGGYRFTLVGNAAWKDLSASLDGEFVDDYIWIDRKRFYTDFIYRAEKLREISSIEYDVAVNPKYSREFFFGDAVIRAAHAKEKIGSIGDSSNIKNWQKRISDEYYTKLLPTKSEIVFEFYRNREFFEKLLDDRIDMAKPTITLGEKKTGPYSPRDYAILFIGANADFRKWGIDKFVKIGKHLKERYGYDIVVCGGPSDRSDADRFDQLADYDYVDLVGKTSLPELLYIIDAGKMMLSNETSAPHLAVALGVPHIFVLSNGNHFGRFTPYPREVWEGYHPIFHPEIEKNLENYDKLVGRYGRGSDLEINDIGVESVKNKIEQVLNG